MNFRKLVEVAIDVASQWEDECNKDMVREDNLGTSIGFAWNDERGALAATSSAPRARSLRSRAKRAVGVFLSRLTEEQALKLQTIMYCGRDRRTDLGEFHRELCSFTSGKEDAVRNMRSKVPLATYLRDGVVILEEAGIDLALDSSFSRS